MEQSFKKRKEKLDLFKAFRSQQTENKETKSNQAPEGIYQLCKSCQTSIPSKELEKNNYVCTQCGAYLSMYAYTRIKLLADNGEFKEFYTTMKTRNALRFPGYERKLVALRKETGLSEGVICATAFVEGIKTMLCVMDSRFLMGSMGAVVGERITRAIEYATKKKMPLVIFCASGGARMQEGIISLMQMAKTSQALARHAQAGQLYISYLTHPTTGGVTASFAMLGDIILAEPKALIGFAGPRVIEQTIGEKLPKGFQRSEFLLEKGFVDQIVARTDMKKTLGLLLRFHQKEGK